jgi:hypothetical protein
MVGARKVLVFFPNLMRELVLYKNAPKLPKDPKCGSLSEIMEKEENWGTLLNLQHFGHRGLVGALGWD